jgi:site-specific recombinase XerD
LNYLEVFTGGRVAFKNIDELWLEKWQRLLLEKVSRNTAVDYYSLTKAALNQAVRDRIIQDNPCRRVQNIKRQDTERNFLTFAEIKHLSETLPKAEYSKEVARMFLFGCFTGLSLGNLETLTYKQIEDDTVKFFRTKTKTWHYVPLNETALSLIGDTFDCDPNGRIFNTPSRRYSQTLLEKWGQHAGIKKHVHMHLSRHAFATLNISSGADLYTVSQLIGHKKLATTQIYAKVIDEKKRQAVDALPQLKL